MLKKTAQKVKEKGDFFMKIEKTADGIKVTETSGLSLPETLDCGQCFRWKPDENGIWRGVVKGIYGKIRKEEDGITFLGADENIFNEIFGLMLPNLNKISPDDARITYNTNSTITSMLFLLSFIAYSFF